MRTCSRYSKYGYYEKFLMFFETNHTVNETAGGICIAFAAVFFCTGKGIFLSLWFLQNLLRGTLCIRCDSAYCLQCSESTLYKKQKQM